MRLTSERLREITGLKFKKSQTAWFLLHLGVEVPCDRIGPIVSEEAFEKLLEKRLGLTPSHSNNEIRPSVKFISNRI